MTWKFWPRNRMVTNRQLLRGRGKEAVVPGEEEEEEEEEKEEEEAGMNLRVRVGQAQRKLRPGEEGTMEVLWSFRHGRQSLIGTHGWS